MDDKDMLGLIEPIKIVTEHGEKTVLARIDTGAQNSSIDLGLAQELRLGPIIGTKGIRSSHGTSLRPLVAVNIKLGNLEHEEEFTLYNRSHMRYKVLVGQNILKKGYLIDPNKELDESQE